MKKTRFKDLEFHSPDFHLIGGQPDTGKTVLAMSLGDTLHKQTGKPVLLALEESDREPRYYGCPDYIQGYREAIPPPDCIFITDVAHRRMHARRAMADINVYLDTVHGTLRHDDIDYIYDTQTVSSIDKNNILRSKYRWYKMPYYMEVEYGRPEIEDELLAARDAGLGVKEALLFTEGDEIRVTDIPLPDYYGPELSRMHRRRGPGRVVIR